MALTEPTPLEIIKEYGARYSVGIDDREWAAFMKVIEYKLKTIEKAAYDRAADLACQIRSTSCEKGDYGTGYEAALSDAEDNIRALSDNVVMPE